MDVEMSEEPILDEDLHPLQKLVIEAKETNDETVLRSVISADTAEDVRGVKAQEQAIFALGKIIVNKKDVEGVKKLLIDVRPLFAVIAKSRTSRIVRRLFEFVSSSGTSLEDQLTLVNEFIDWAKKEKQSYLRQRLQARLAELNFQLQKYPEAISILSGLIREVRKMDDKPMLVDVHILDSRVCYAIKNQSKAKASLVAARTAAHSIYIPPLTQADIDMQSGIIAAEEKDFRSAYSYFYESFEGYHGSGEHQDAAENALKYLLLSKVLDGSVSDIPQLLVQKHLLPYRDLRVVASLKDIADAYKHRDLHRFNQVRKEYDDVFADDLIAQNHLTSLYHQLLEQHLLRVIEPYSRVEITHLASLIKLDASTIEAKLSQMILDDKLYGILDQAHHCLIVYPEKTEDALYPDALATLENLHSVVDALMDKCAGKFLPKKEEDSKEKKDDKDKDEKAKDSDSTDKKDEQEKEDPK